MSQEYYDELIADIAILRKAIRMQVKEAYYGDKRVVYNSRKEMMQTLNDLLEEAGLKKPNQNRTFASVTMGFGKTPGCIEGL